MNKLMSYIDRPVVYGLELVSDLANLGAQHPRWVEVGIMVALGVSLYLNIR